MPVAEEAALTAEAFGNETVRLYDVGVRDSTALWLIWTISCPPVSSSRSPEWKELASVIGVLQTAR